MKFKSKILIVFILLFLSSCSSGSKDSCVNQLLEDARDSANRELKIDVPKHMNTFKINDNVVVVVENLSQDVVSVVPDTGLRFYRMDGGTWVPVENRVDFLGVTNSINPKTNLDPGGMIYTGVLNLSDIQNPVAICILVEGTKNESDLSSIVGAFLEITLNPISNGPSASLSQK